MKEQDMFSYCPKCGAQNQKKHAPFICENCSYRHYFSPKPAVAILIKNEKGELLLSRRNIEPHRGTLELPGGFVDPDETFEDAIQREVFEELGLTIEKKDLSYFTSVVGDYVYQDILYKVVFPVYMLTLKECPVFSKDEKEIQEIKFFPIKDIDPDQIGLMGDREAIRQYISL